MKTNWFMLFTILVCHALFIGSTYYALYSVFGLGYTISISVLHWLAMIMPFTYHPATHQHD